MANILIVDDDPLACKMLSFWLTTEGFKVLTARDAETTMALLKQREMDLLVVEVMLPRMDGFALCQRLRAEGRRTPVIFLTANNNLTDRVHGLQLGADDYIVKPFEARELVARVKGVLRRYQQSRSSAQDVRLRVGDVILDIGALRVHLPGRRVASLTRSEAKVLHCLMANAGEAVGRDVLAGVLWGICQRGADQISVYVRRLRQKIEPDPSHPRYIESVRSFGYRFRSSQ